MGIQNLWAPWRMDYIRQLDQTPQTENAQRCFLCQAASVKPDSAEAQQLLVLVNDSRGLILLNRFPYTSGHLLVACREHLGDLSDLSSQQRTDLMELTALAVEMIRAAYNPQGFNIGINIGRCAGAGLPGHLHVHVVPRWNGDTNYMQVIGQVRVIPQALEASYQQLSEARRKLLRT